MFVWYKKLIQKNFLFEILNLIKLQFSLKNKTKVAYLNVDFIMKQSHLCRGLSLFIAAGVCAGAAHAQVSTGLVAKYSFEDNLNDSSTGNRTGVGKDLSYVEGKVGKAIAFNGTSSNMKVDALAGVLPSGNAPRTIAFWMYAESGQVAAGNMVSWGTSSASLQRYSIRVNANGYLDFIGENNDVNLHRQVNHNTWHHVVITYDSGTFTSYIDGVQNRLESGLRAFQTNSLFGLILGEGPPHLRTGQEYFKGRLDEVLIYDRVLTYEEIVNVSEDETQVPSITAVSPAMGSPQGGTGVTITGKDFTGASEVKFGPNAATSFTVVSDTEITATTPAGAAGEVDVVVSSPSGASAVSSASKFTYAAVPVDGRCGLASGVRTSFIPLAQRCEAGNPTSVAYQNGAWAWSCEGVDGGAASACSAPLGDTATNTGPVRAVVGADDWVVDPVASAGFIPVSGHAASPTTAPPAGVDFPHGLLDVVLVSGAAGSSTMLTVTYPQPLPDGAVYYKFGPTQSNAQPHWHVYPHAAISGNTVVLTLTDGQDGDADLSENSRIQDPGGVAVVRSVAAAAVQPVPSLSQSMLGLLGLLLAAVMGRSLLARKR